MRNVIRATLRRAVPRTKKTYLLQPLVVDRANRGAVRVATMRPELASSGADRPAA